MRTRPKCIWPLFSSKGFTRSLSPCLHPHVSLRLRVRGKPVQATSLLLCIVVSLPQAASLLLAKQAASLLHCCFPPSSSKLVACKTSSKLVACCAISEATSLRLEGGKQQCLLLLVLQATSRRTQMCATTMATPAYRSDRQTDRHKQTERSMQTGWQQQ